MELFKILWDFCGICGTFFLSSNKIHHVPTSSSYLWNFKTLIFSVVELWNYFFKKIPTYLIIFTNFFASLL